MSGPRMCRVISAYRSPYTAPWVMRAGQELAIGQRESEWAGWVWCTNQDGESRWVPESFLERHGDAGIALRDYEATELPVEAGEELAMGEEESDWIWCTNREGQSGWVPAEHVERLP
jgi:hypothetical protein